MASPARPRVRFGDGAVLQLRIELLGITPPVWRRILVSERASLHELHEIIHRAMSRNEDGGYAFDVDGVRYVDADDEPNPGRDAEAVAVGDLELHHGARFVYTAEHHGEPWRYVITLEEVSLRTVGQRLPICVGGGRAAPPDECDGPSAYRDMLTALDELHDPRSADIRTWLPEDFDPEFVDLTRINAGLSKVPKHRPAA